MPLKKGGSRFLVFVWHLLLRVLLSRTYQYSALLMLLLLFLLLLLQVVL